jgi:hypothetical protein
MLFAFSSIDIQFEKILISDEENKEMAGDRNGKKDEYQKIMGVVKSFADQYKKLKDRRLGKLMNSLSEIISINPNYSQEKMIADKLFTFLFHQIWSQILTREEQQCLAEGFNKYFLSSASLVVAAS